MCEQRKSFFERLFDLACEAGYEPKPMRLIPADQVSVMKMDTSVNPIIYYCDFTFDDSVKEEK